MSGGETAAIVWVNERRAPAVRGICAAAGLRPVAAGSPDAGRSAAVAETLGCKTAGGDLRAALASASESVFLIADPGDFAASGEGSDAEAALAAHRRGVTIVALEPLPASARAASDGGWLTAAGGARPIDVVRVCPRPRLGPGFVEAAELLQHLGPIREAAIICGGSPLHGSAARRLLDGLELAAGLLGEPELIHASATPPARGRDRTLRDLAGTVAAALRLADGRLATVFATDRWATFERRVDLLLDDGRVTVTPHGFRHFGADGLERDRHESRDGAMTWRSAAAAGLRELLDGDAPTPGDPRIALAMAETALLSVRTGQAESTGTILRVM